MKLPGRISIKHTQIDKENLRIIVATSLAMASLAFLIVASRALFSQRAYQSRVIKEQNVTLDNISKSNAAYDKLVSNYKAWQVLDPNIIGGKSAGTGADDGDNTKLLLNALPSKYDYPNVVSSFNKLFADASVSSSGVLGTDDEVKQLKNNDYKSAVSVPVTTNISTPYDKAESALKLLDSSIRPIKVKSLNITGRQDNVQIALVMETFYQPKKTLKTSTKEVK